MLPLPTLSLFHLAVFMPLASHSAATPTDPKITPPPTSELVERQDSDRGTGFVGYTSYQGSFYPQSCGSGKSIIRSGSQWAGCGAGDSATFDIATACESGSVMICPTIKYTCASVQPACASIIVYNDLDRTSAYSMVACFNQQVKMTLFEETTGSTALVTSTKESESSTVLSSEASSASRSIGQSSSLTSSHSTSSTTSMSSSTSASDSNSSSDSSSSHRDLAWIAGPIVGGIAGIITIALMIWMIKLLRGRREGASNTATPPAAQSGQPQAQYYPTYQWQVVGQQNPPQQGQEYGGFVIPAELHDSALPGELQVDIQKRSEK